MRNYHRLIILTLLALPMFSCSKKRASTADAWFSRTKKEIFRQSSYSADSVDISYYQNDSSFASKYFYFKGRKVREQRYRGTRLGAETSFSKDGDFEFRREICGNGNYGFEGIFYKGKPYGLSTWYYCSDKSRLQLQGVRVKGEKIGVWKKWSEEGDLVEEIDYGRSELLDSLPQLR